MSGFPRDLAVVDPWEASLQRSLARRARASSARRTNTGAATTRSSLIELRGGRDARDLCSEELWELSLGRSRARRRSAELQFVPTGSRAKRMSLGALAALSVAPVVSIIESGGGSAAVAGAQSLPATTTSHAVTLEQGTEGRHVRQLQRALGGVKVDGVFGTETERAVRSFQASKGLQVDGVVGPATVAALRDQVATTTTFASFHPQIPGYSRAIAASEAQPSSTAADAVTADATPAPSPETAESGTETAGPEAGATDQTGSTAQTGVTDQAGSTAETGATSAGGATAETGFLSETTAGESGETSEAPATAAPEAKPTSPVSEAEEKAAKVKASAEEAAQQKEEQAETDAVKRLQSALHVPVDGEFGPHTEAAIRRLQARHGLTVDGVAGPATWKLIGVHSETTLTPPPSALPQPPAPHVSHHRRAALAEEDPAGGGASAQTSTSTGGGDSVSRLQSALKLPTDGEFGPETEAAIRRLQARHGLTVDGVVGPATWRLLGIHSDSTLTPPPSAIVHEEAGTSGGGGGDGGSSSTAGGGEGVVARVIAAADEIATRPYVYGGGHGSFQSEGYDCSGSVSYALHGGGLLSSPEDSTGLESYGDPGPGRYITIYANAEHAWMVIDGRRFDTVAQAETGTRWSDSMASTGGFVVRHPAGL